MKRLLYISVGLAVCAGLVLVFGIRPSVEFLHILPQEEPIRILFVGDLMFDRGVARHASLYGADSLMKGAQSFLQGNDVVIGNLEGTITTEKSVASRTTLHFTFDPKFADVLRQAGFTILGQANNHASDFYRAGFKSTQAYLDGAGIGHFGSAYNDDQLSTTTLVRGKRLCFVGYHDLYTHDELPIIAEIVHVRSSCDFVTVFAHWGEEYKLEASPRQVQLAHEFIDAGADLVIGAHPHVVQPIETYKGKEIFYSLGNFVFDQGLSFWTEHGLAVRALLYEDRTEFELIPTELNAAEVRVADAGDAQKVLEAVRASSTLILGK